MNLISVVLSGGAGTRLWPESRKAMPKPFMNVGGSTLLAQTFRRGLACGAAHTVIVTNQDYLFLTADVARDVASTLAVPDGSCSTQLPPKFDYVLEPTGRNTAPAIAIAALQCAEQFGHDAVMLVLAADHLIPDTEAFVACVEQAAVAAAAGQLVVFGVVPTSPETGFGYIEVSKPSAEVQSVLRFVEKPSAATAMQYLQTGRYYWNSGMFCFTAKTILTALAQHAPAVMNAAQTAWAARQVSPGSNPGMGSTTRFEASSFSAMTDISIDYAVMEPAAQVPGAVAVVPSSFFWSDVGSWPAIADAHAADDQGNTFLHDVVASHTSGTHVQVQSHGPKVVATIGVENLIIVDTPDALLVAHKSAAHHIKHVVDTLKTRGADTAAHQTTQLPATVHRPWGTYASLKEEAGYKVKRITVKPGEALSLQYHHQRAEHWVVVQGTALIQVGEETFTTPPGEYRYIPLKAKHRLTNLGTDLLILIEVQCGAYLGEDDIVRLADTYGRVVSANAP